MDYAWIIGCMDYAWIMNELCMDYAWTMHGLYSTYLCTIILLRMSTNTRTLYFTSLLIVCVHRRNV